ncbi:hypothetical protein CEQ90_02365 [Lewinellaceae bacterium SD302]|nr:hypothetical protein CEQ90_02365 [Lewinellaceae bacterium SD302]
MQRITTSFFTLLLLLAVTSLSAQTRYLDEIFDVTGPTTETYATNLSFGLMFQPDELECNIYEPANEDSDQLRPVVVLWPTGNFLPAYLNQGPYGTQLDSANVTTLRKLAARGYVGIHAEYRFGWLPGADDQVTRTETLLKAAYRGGQDAHAMARWLRMTVAEEGNPYQIDTNRIVFWGFGTGGYVALTHAFLDDVDELIPNIQFYDDEGNLLIDEAEDSNPQGTTATMFNMVNTPGYNSDVAMSLNSGGALGDPAWIDGGGNEPIVIGHHHYTDFFAPYNVGTVIVPTTGETVVSGVAGTRRVVELANESGLNDALEPANAFPLPDMFGPLASAVNAINQGQQGVTVDLAILNPADQTMGALSVPNMFTHAYTSRLANEGNPTSGTYNWIDLATAQFVLAQVEMMFPGVPPTFEALIAGESMFNPNYDNPEQAKLTIDTMLAHFLPRAWYGLNLEELVNTEELVQADAIGLTVAPNPASEYFLVNTENERILEASLFDINGREVATFGNVNNTSLRVDRNNLPNGQYILRVRVEQGIVTQKVMIH